MSLSGNAKPILFNTEAVKAILEGRKTQTRRIIPKKFEITQIPEFNANGDENIFPFRILDKKLLNVYDTHDISGCFNHYIKYGYKVGDILYVKEKFQLGSNIRNIQNIPLLEDIEVLYYEKEINSHNQNNRDFAKVVKWKPSIHLKERYARIFLKVTNIRVERLQDISKESALKEIGKGSWICELLNMYPHYQDYTMGFNDIDYDLQGKNVNGAICSFRTLWNSTAKDGYKWEDNPYVFVYEFERVEK